MSFRTVPAVLSIAASTLFVVSSSGCVEERATNEEFRSAVDEVVATGEAATVQDDIIEITTSFTLADGAEAVAQEVRSFVESQIPCSEVSSPSPRTVSIDFGELQDDCTYRGRTYAGVVTVGFEVEDSAVVVTHQYDGLTQGTVTMNGSAVVTWSEGSRNVQTDFDFTTPRGEIAVTSDRTQTPLGGIGDGIEVDGRRAWTGPSGEWDLEIDSVQMRGADPVPQSGSYILVNPNQKEFTLSFQRRDDDTIRVSITGPRRDFQFDVSRSGDVERS